jgi:hypothetical protein
MSKAPELGNSFVQSISRESAVDLVKEYAEVGIDAVFADGILRDLPVVRTVFALARAGISIGDRLLLKKILKFLYELQSISVKQRSEMIERLEADPDYGRKVGEHLVELLERVESERKPAMLARVFKAYVNSEIDANILNRLNMAVERIPLFEIGSVRLFRDSEPTARQKIDATFLVNAGLANIGSGWGALVFTPNDICNKFLQLDLDRLAA